MSEIPPNSARDKARLRLAELNELIDALVAERQQIQEELDSIVYPVLDLPAEIAAHIFTLSLPKDRRTPSQFTSPLLLTQICHSWREIAVTTPNLWQSIQINESRAPHRDTGRLLEMWLQRSASLPLFLSFRIAIASSDAAQSLIDACLIHHRRWRELELFSELSTDGAVRVDCADKEFPLLRKVTLRSWGDVSWGAIIIQNAPMLREAYVEGIFDMRLPWSQLAQLSLFTYDSAADCLPILTQCSDLLLHLVHETILPQPVTNLFNEPHFTLNSLDSLKVNGSAIVPHLTLPRLRNLVLSRNIAVAIEPFQALFCRSNCSLQQLTVVADRYDSKLNPPTLLSLFQLVPTLTDLTLDLQSVAVHQVITSLSSPNTLPALATLLIVAYRVRDEYDDLLAVLRSRHANNTLKCFSLTLRPHKDAASPEPTSPLPQAALAHFRDLADGGLQCRIVLERKPWPLVLLDTFAPSVLLAEVFLQPSS